MQFISTRGRAAALGFSDAVLAGLASDGGLYVPQTWPQLTAAEIAGFANKPYATVAFDNYPVADLPGEPVATG